MNHPGPWKHNSDTNQVEDANGIVVADGVSPSAASIILAAPELLAALKYVLEHPPGTHYGSMGAENARDLIDRIEKGGT